MEEQKEKMDDLASLFLPDLLHPLSTFNQDALVKQEDDGFHAALFQTDEPKMSSYNNGMNMQMTDQDPLLQFNSDNYYTMNMGPTQNHMANYVNQFGSNRFLPHTGVQEEGLSHTLHYQDFVPAEAAGLQPPLRYHQNQKQYLTQHVMPFQPAWSPLTVIGQFDGMNYGSMSPQPSMNNPSMAMPMQGLHVDMDEPQHFGHPKSATPELQHNPFQTRGDLNRGIKRHNTMQIKQEDTQPASSNHSDNGDSSSFKLRKRRQKSSKRGDADPDSPPPYQEATVSSIKVDYDPKKLQKLLDLHPATNRPSVQIVDHENKPVDIVFRGFLTGRFYTNNHDNFNHISATREIPRLDEQYNAEVISCYRRNFIRISVNFRRSGEGNLLAIPNKGIIKRFRIDVLAFANGEDAKPIPVLINTQKESMKDSNKGFADAVYPALMDCSHEVSIADSSGDNYFTIRKGQFKEATSNSMHVSFQTFNNFSIRLIAELRNEVEEKEVIVKELKSSPIIVRGRNPSFYHKRGDVLIDSRPAISRSSFVLSEKEPSEFGRNALPVLSSGLTEQHERPPDSKNSRLPDSPSDNSSSELTAPKSAFRRHTPTPSGAALATNLGDLLDPKSFVNDKGEHTKYRYFPILSVYYLPPINVVYFPHRAHQLKQETNSDANVEEDRTTHATTTSTSGKQERKKSTSKFYFR